MIKTEIHNCAQQAIKIDVSKHLIGAVKIMNSCRIQLL